MGAWLKRDGNRPAVFETTDMPRGIRPIAQPAAKVPFQDGPLAAQGFDEGKYKAWYVSVDAVRISVASGLSDVASGPTAWTGSRLSN